MTLSAVHACAELRARVAAWRGEGARIALVPTMGNLHQGHLDLVAAARAAADRVVASVFVNPLQFGPREDFHRYPRTLEQDRAQLAAAGCDLLFAPTEAEIYPLGRADLTTVRAPALGSELEGAFRPGFFDGVATVVSILFNLVQPDVAMFGMKDYQQLQVIRRVVRDLHLPLEIRGVPTRRAGDGLALSSRNQYLSADERARAPALYRALSTVAAGLRAGRRDYALMCEEAVSTLVAAGFAPQYLEVRDPELRVPDQNSAAWAIVGAAHLGSTRLIDNVLVDDRDLVPNGGLAVLQTVV